jgi:hypothetical protein
MRRWLLIAICIPATLGARSGSSEVVPQQTKTPTSRVEFPIPPAGSFIDPRMWSRRSSTGMPSGSLPDLLFTNWQAQALLLVSAPAAGTGRRDDEDPGRIVYIVPPRSKYPLTRAGICFYVSPQACFRFEVWQDHGPRPLYRTDWEVYEEGPRIFDWNGTTDGSQHAPIGKYWVRVHYVIGGPQTRDRIQGRDPSSVNALSKNPAKIEITN